MKIILWLFGLYFEVDSNGDEFLHDGNDYKVIHYGAFCPHHEFGVVAIDGIRFDFKAYLQARWFLIKHSFMNVKVAPMVYGRTERTH